MTSYRSKQPDITDITLMEAASDDLAGAEAVTEMSMVAEDAATYDVDVASVAEPYDASDVPSEVTRSPERVFISGQKNPVVLRQNSAELFLLTRARDEAHRFAITFHRELRGKASTRSALDSIPGIGPKRRKMLLRAFGSITRLKAAPFDEVAKVVGAVTAKRVLEGLT